MAGTCEPNEINKEIKHIFISFPEGARPKGRQGSRPVDCVLRNLKGG